MLEVLVIVVFHHSIGLVAGHRDITSLHIGLIWSSGNVDHVSSSDIIILCVCLVLECITVTSCSVRSIGT